MLGAAQAVDATDREDARVPHAVLLAYSAIPDDPRVRRMGDFLIQQGWDVVGIGLSGARSEAPKWPVFEALGPNSAFAHTSDHSASDLKSKHRETSGAGVARRTVVNIVLLPFGLCAAVGGAISALLLTPFRPRLAKLAWHGMRRFSHPIEGGRRLATAIIRFAQVRQKGAAAERLFWSLSPDLPSLRDAALSYGRAGVWVANDWLTLPAAVAGAQRHGGVVVYDSHEFATEEYSERPDWRLFQRPLVQTIERRFIKEARVVTSVSPGIADALKAMYRLDAPVFAFRNMPPYVETAFRPTGSSIRVLYHGAVAPGRGLEEAIDSVPLWRPEFMLTIRGPSSPREYVDNLGKRIQSLGLSDRIFIEPPVPATELVRAAAAHDVGFFALPGHSLHNEFALPNKVFEYMMGGLALVLSDLTEMRRIVESHGSGVLMPGLTPDAIASTVNALTPADIDRYKRASLEAAKNLHWDADATHAAEQYKLALQNVSAVK